MIVDSHTHIFRNWSGACGLPSREIHWKYIQKNVAHPAAKVFRLRDGAPGNPQDLYRAGDETWEGLRGDVQFRVGAYGRMEYTVDGEDYYVQYMPVGMAQMESTPEFMITQMNAAGVTHCVLQAGFTYGYMNDYNALAQQQFPDRFTGLFHVNEPEANSEYWMSEVRRAHNLQLRGMYFTLEGFARYGFRWWFDDSRFKRFWELIESLGVPVFFEISSVPGYDQPSYEGHLHRLDRIMSNHPRIRWLLVMAPPVPYFADNGKWSFSDIALKVYSHENVKLELCFPIVWAGTWEYPFPVAQELIRDLRDKLGAEKLIWGSDMPNLERFCTYKQSLDYIHRHCEFLDSRDRELILGENLTRLMNIATP